LSAHYPPNQSARRSEVRQPRARTRIGPHRLGEPTSVANRPTSSCLVTRWNAELPYRATFPDSWAGGQPATLRPPQIS